MTTWAILGKTLSAALTALFFGGLTLLALDHFFPPMDTSILSLSSIALAGCICTGAVGAWIGWKWAEAIADGLIFEVLQRLLAGAIGLVFKAF